MKFLKFSSLILFLAVVACFPKIPKQQFKITAEKPEFFHQIHPNDTVWLYRTQISSYHKKLSGILVLKPQEKDLKVAFLSDAGINFFSILIQKNNYLVDYCIEDLNKKPILDVLVKDICLISGFIFSDFIRLEKSENMEKFVLSDAIVYKKTDNQTLSSLILSDDKRNKKVICQLKNQNWYVKHTNFSLQMIVEPMMMPNNE